MIFVLCLTDMFINRPDIYTDADGAGELFGQEILLQGDNHQNHFVD